ncbi:MAG TPA: ATP phosphoribosyltransferase regulatory subunit, partial [Allosphingosinicella sp.]
QGGSASADLSIARGFDYYTGTVFEGKLEDYPDFPSICSGGRYDNLVGGFLRKQLPGVGMSIGLTRLFSKMLKEGRVAPGAKGPTQVLVGFPPGVSRAEVADRARRLRGRAVPTEAYHEAHKLQVQLRYAARKGIPFVLFPEAGGVPDQVKDMARGTQFAVPPDWVPSKSTEG